MFGSEMAMDPLERLAADTVASATGGIAEPQDLPGAPPGTHDFDVELPDGRVLALEVTRSTDGRLQAFWRAAAETEMVYPELRDSWHLSVRAPTEIRSLDQEMPRLLGRLEDLGIEELDVDDPGDDPRVVDVAEALEGLRVRAVASLGPADDSAFVTIGTVSGFMTGPDLVVRAIESEIPPNLDKLRRAEADVRHLWVWIELERPAASMSFGELPEVAPQLPDWIGGVWAGRGHWDGEAQRPVVDALWVFVSGQGWVDRPDLGCLRFPV